MITTMDKTDMELKTDVLAELEFEPSVKVTDIGVLVKDGIVTLKGSASSFGAKWNAVHAAKRVAGVKAIADDIQVILTDSHHRNDGDIAAVAAHQIDWSTMVPPGSVEVTVREGRITLEGMVEWWYQKTAAENAVVHLAGVKAVMNLITLKPKMTPLEIATVIRSAFERNALLDAKKLHVETFGSKVVLQGRVRNHAEREEAERIAWAVSGVLSVDNEIKVEWWNFLG